MGKVDGWQSLAGKPCNQIIDFDACSDRFFGIIPTQIATAPYREESYADWSAVPLAQEDCSG